jgi:hypothetical protein
MENLEFILCFLALRLFVDASSTFNHQADEPHTLYHSIINQKVIAIQNLVPHVMKCEQNL